ncbi:hypothetical protein DRH27_00735 [Candidatus Falkowbacteria bacterium]|nr:MAG: hypothetical protein DRH27_00735 [Candidatus Falkowbacteria bacterium]
MNKNLKQVIFLFILVLVLVLPFFVFADNQALQGLKNIQPDSGYAEADSENNFATIAGTIVGGLLSILGIIFISLMIYGGLNWMIASGDEEKLTRAKNTLRRAIIGIVIVIGSYAIWDFVLWKLIQGG